MKIKVITPVGPGHEKCAEECMASVRDAHEMAPHIDLMHVLVDDTDGKHGRSAARNSAIHGADWYFFLDADDLMEQTALLLNDESVVATFGAVKYNGKVLDCNVWPCTQETIRKQIEGTLSMGFFYRDVGLRFNEDLDKAEDFDFYVRLPSFTKIKQPLVSIRGTIPSAGGPRGYTEIDWLKECADVVENYDNHAVLGTTQGGE